MRTYTGSTSCDDRATRGNDRGKIMVNLKENVRDPEEIRRLNEQCIQYGKPPHYDLEKAQRNIVYEQCLTTDEAFMDVFGEAMEAFNSQQKRSDRKTSMEKELEKLQKGKVKQELIHTMIIQVGNKESRPDEEECVDILQEYLAEFRERFPNMRIVSAAIHLDEDTPHLQLYYIPIKTREQHEAMQTGKKWSGMDVQPSLKGALEQMGYTNDATILVPKKDENGEPILAENGEPVMVQKHDYKQGAMAQWQKDFNGLLDEICLEHGIEIDHYQRGQKVSHQDTLDYQEGKIQAAVQYAKDELETVQLFTAQERETLQEAREEAARLKTENNTLKEQNEALRTNNAVLEGRAEAMEQRATNAEARLVKAQGAFGRLKDAVAAWVDAHQGLQRVLRAAFRLSEVNRDKIETRAENTVKRGNKALSEASESVEDLLAAADEMDRGKRVFSRLKQAVKEDLDPDDLLDDMER